MRLAVRRFIRFDFRSKRVHGSDFLLNAGLRNFLIVIKDNSPIFLGLRIRNPVTMTSVMKLTTYSYRFAAEVLASPAFLQLREDVMEIFQKIEAAPRLKKIKTRTRSGKAMEFTTDQKGFNALLDTEFKARDWEVHPLVTNDGVTNIKADYKKGRVQVEVQFGNMARWYTDVFKFQVSYSLTLIDVGVLVVPMQSFAATIDENVAYYERVVRELPYAKMSLTLPILVLGIEP
jgi:hypothetical protein